MVWHLRQLADEDASDVVDSATLRWTVSQIKWYSLKEEVDSEEEEEEEEEDKLDQILEPQVKISLLNEK